MTTTTGWYVETLGGQAVSGPHADEIDASEAMDGAGLSDTTHKLVYRPGTTSAAQNLGPWADGILVSFGDGTDTDTTSSVFAALLGWNVRVNGTDYNVTEIGDDHLTLQPYSDELGEADPEAETVRLDWDLVHTIHVY